VELRKRLLNMLYIWIASHHSLNVFTSADFLISFLFILSKGTLVYFMCIKIAPLCALLMN
jgi:hypothetical protein